jgi:transcriptional regulator with XRE-family HTH domain
MDEDLFGRRLRSERERRHITLESIAENTKISIGLLRDLERDDVSRWPSGIFRRSFVRSYAEAIGLDADDIVREFLDRHPDAQQLEALAAYAAANGGARRPRPKTVFRLTLADSPQRFSGGRLLTRISSRLAAAAWDAGTTLALALTAFVVLGQFWTPLGVVMLCYYIGGILVLGNTPGVCLFAPRSHDDPPQPPTSPEKSELPDLASAAVFERSFNRSV